MTAKDVPALDHNPYTCDPDCCETHEASRCCRCGEPRTDDYLVAYVVGEDLQPGDEFYGLVPRGIWATLCGVCADATMEA